jgi:hypothetical protein
VTDELRAKAPETGHQWIDQTMERATKDFSRHRMTEVGPGHWRIKRPKESPFWADIVVLGGNRAISVWGDIEACTFAYCSGATTPEHVVHWMANADPSYYGKQKAEIGMGGVGVDQYESDIAENDLKSILAEEPENWGEAWPDVEETYEDAFDAAIARLRLGVDVQHIHSQLMDALHNVDSDAWEWIPQIGRVTSSRVIYALAAIRRLAELMKAKEKEHGDAVQAHCAV